jgi:hypothetical protein
LKFESPTINNVPTTGFRPKSGSVTRLTVTPPNELSEDPSSGSLRPKSGTVTKLINLY